MPAEVLPLVGAINHHIGRNREQAEARRRFPDSELMMGVGNLTELTVPIVDALSGRVALELRYTSDPPPEASASRWTTP